MVITYYQDKSFTFEIKTPPASFLIKEGGEDVDGQEAGLWLEEAGRGFRSASMTMAQCKEIAKTKQKDLNAADLDQAAKMIAGTARSMGVQVVE